MLLETISVNTLLYISVKCQIKPRYKYDVVDYTRLTVKRGKKQYFALNFFRNLFKMNKSRSAKFRLISERFKKTNFNFNT